MSDDLSLLRSLSNAIQPLSTAEWEKFSAIWEPFTAKRKQLITSPGEKEKYLYFVTEGVQRIYFMSESGKEATLVFTYAPSFGGVLDSFLLQQSSKYYYETITASKFLRASFTELDSLMKELPAVEALFRKGLSGVIAGLLERMAELQCFSSEEKFRILLKRSPHILNIVPHKYLANYIGIDPTNFSKMVNSVRI